MRAPRRERMVKNEGKEEEKMGVKGMNCINP